MILLEVLLLLQFEGIAARLKCARMAALWQKIQEGSPANVKFYIAATATAVGVVYVASRWMVWSRVSKKIKRKRAKCQAAFEEVENNLKALELDGKESLKILNLTSAELQHALQDGSLKAVDVLHVYQSRAIEVNQRLNAVTEPLLDADSTAAACDSLTGEKGLLHGMPVSLKENYRLRDSDATAGLGQFIGEIAAEDAVLVKVLKKQGAVPFVRTNIPQLMMTYECSNPVFGQTHNPYDVSRGPGGSSGGEGALIGAGASIIGFGSDVGGSIRVPSHMCGCYGLKTTLERLSRKGAFSPSKGQTQVSGTVGPMARDLDGLLLAMKALLCNYHFELDPKVAPVPFRTEIYESTKPLRVGFYVHDGYVKPVPACQKAVLMAKAALEKRGHTVVEFTPPNIKSVYPKLYLATVLGDGARTYNTVIKKDICDPVVKQQLFGTTWPKAVQWIISWVLQVLYRDPVFGKALRRRMGHASVYDWFRQAEALQAYKEEFLSAWREQKLDAVICPVFATTAVPYGKVFSIIASGTYSMLYNVLNYPAGSMPVTKVTADDVINMKDYPTKTQTEKIIQQITHGSEGLPVNVQCVGLPFQEELVLRLMKEIEFGLGK